MTAKLNIDEVNNALKDLNSCLSEDKKWIFITISTSIYLVKKFMVVT